jgi:hypothetical protein
MALPQQVIDRLSKEPPRTPGWSVNILLFSGGIFFISLLVYFGMVYGYEPYLTGQISQLSAQMDALAKSISPDDQAQLVSFYSEITNIKNVLGNHVILSRFLSWLEQHTEANVYYAHLTFGAGNQVGLSGIAQNEADVSQQMAIFESAPEVKTVTLANVSLAPTGGQWQFNMTLVMDSASVLRQSP